MVSERYELEIERISEIGKESLQTEALTDYFRKGAAFWLLLEEERKFLETEAATAPLSVWSISSKLYEKVSPPSLLIPIAVSKSYGKKTIFFFIRCSFARQEKTLQDNLSLQSVN